MTLTPTEQRPSECKHYGIGTGYCYKDHCNPHRCCMEVVKPLAMCFYYESQNIISQSAINCDKLR